MTPADYARTYGQLYTWLWNGSGWGKRQAPIVNYLQHKLGKQSENAQLAQNSFFVHLARAAKSPNIAMAKTFTFNGWDYINNCIRRCFMGKGSPWEIQETLWLASEIGAVAEDKLEQYCRSSLGVDCGGFVANYWGVGSPKMTNVTPPGWSGILPRNFWSNSEVWPDAQSRRRQNVSEIREGDAAIFFKNVKDNNPDIVQKKDAQGKWIAKTGSQAFHIALVKYAGWSSDKFTALEIAEFAGSSGSLYGGDGVNVRSVTVRETGKSGKWVYCESGENQRIYFVAPPNGWASQTPYDDIKT